MQYTATVENGEITIPPILMAELGWSVGDDLLIESTEAGVLVRPPPGDQSDA
jgi:bifunctional DNA-binding transcriptional regulator/antitoxin component of YhaV-PrlF toxin-antitoxin module